MSSPSAQVIFALFIGHETKEKRRSKHNAKKTDLLAEPRLSKLEPVSLLTGVARWFFSKPKVSIWVDFGGP
jgi:hypothetical protein